MTATATAPAALDHRAAHALGAGVVSAHLIRLLQVEARAVARGWTSMAEAITATADLSLSEAGRRLGVSHDTVQRWRIRLLHHG